jgi:hypothetical protein
VIAGYEPERVASLAIVARSCLHELAAISSGDEAAAQAMKALRGLRSAIDGRLRPAVDAILELDPLRDTRSISELTFDLYGEFVEMMGRPGPPELGDAFFTEELPNWVARLEERAESDPNFVDHVIDRAADNPLIGWIIASGNFSDDAVLGVTRALMSRPPTRERFEQHRDKALDKLFDRISSQPDLALTFLHTEGTVETLLSLDTAVGRGARYDVDGASVGAVFEAALHHPFKEPTRTDEAREVVIEIVHLTHGSLLDRGFPPGTQFGLASGILPHLPSIVGSLGDLTEPVDFVDAGERHRHTMGNPAELVDFFGALLRNDEARVLMLAAIPKIAIGLDATSAADFANLMGQSAATEQIEEAIHAERTRASWRAPFDLLDTVLDLASPVGDSYPKAGAALAGGKVIGGAADWLIDRIEATDLRLDGVAHASHLMLTFGASVAVLSRRADDRSTSDDSAWDLATEIETDMKSGAPPAVVERKVRNLRELVADDPGAEEILSVLNDERIQPPPYDAARDAELTGS